MDLQMEITEEVKNNNNWKTCMGSSSDKRLLTFIATLIISVSVLNFSFFMIANRSLSCPELNTYVSLISLVIGIWLKSPTG